MPILIDFESLRKVCNNNHGYGCCWHPKNHNCRVEDCPIKEAEPTAPMSLSKLQREQAEWSEKNFPNQKPYQCLIGIVEEIGELSHAHLKMEQGIRSNEDHLAKKKDAVGDIVTYLAGYCTANNLDFESCVSDAWNEVKKRDWTRNKING